MSDTDAPPPSAPSHWEFARALEVEGIPRAEIESRLKGRGLDVESARVLVNSLPGAPGPSKLPELSLDIANNPLSGGGVSSADIGMSGPRKLVGLYWASFGAALITIAGMLLFAGFAGWTDPLNYGVRMMMKAGIALGAGAIAFGLNKIFGLFGGASP